MSHLFVASLARALGAVHFSVGVTLVSSREKVPLAAAILAGCGVFWLGRTSQTLPWRVLVLRVYIAPVTVPGLVHLWEVNPSSWEAGLSVFLDYASAVWALTPTFAYFLILSFSCLSAAERRGRFK